MPEDDDLDPDPEPQPAQENHDLRRLREKAKGADDAAAARDAAIRELAFVKAGIDPDEKRNSYFVQGYQGELTKEAIRAEAEAAGFLGTAHTSEPEGMTPEERQAFAASSAAAAGSGNNEQPAADFYAEFRNRDYRSGESPENFGMRIAQKIAADGGEVAFNGPFREWKGDTGIIPRPGTPLPRRV